MKKRDCGLYKFVHSLTQQVIYIGKTEDSFKSRIDAHFRGKGLDEKFLPYTKDGCEVYIHRLVNNAEKKLVGNLETALINLYKPILNEVNKCDGLSVFLDVKKFEWEKWEDEDLVDNDYHSMSMAVDNTDEDKIGNNINKSKESPVRKDYDLEKNENENSHDSDEYYICAIKGNANEYEMSLDNHIDYGNSEIKVEHDKGSIIITLDKCIISFYNWNYDLLKLREVLQTIWKDWEEYKSLNDGNGPEELLPHVTSYPEKFGVTIKRGGCYSANILADWELDGRKINFNRKNVWMALKLLDIVLEDSGDKARNIKKLFNRRDDYSKLVYHPWSEIAYCPREDEDEYEIELEGKHITFSTGFTGDIYELKQLVNKAWQYCMQTNIKFVTSSELRCVLEFPSSLLFMEGCSFGFDVVTSNNKDKRVKTAVSVEAVRKMENVLEILTDDKNEKTRRVEKYLMDDLGNSASLDTTLQMINIVASA